VDLRNGGAGRNTFQFGFVSNEVDSVSDFFSEESVILYTGFGNIDRTRLTGSELNILANGTSSGNNVLSIGNDRLTVTESGKVLSLSFNGTLFAELSTDGWNTLTS
jgi:hypothetical protein